MAGRTFQPPALTHLLELLLLRVGALLAAVTAEALPSARVVEVAQRIRRELLLLNTVVAVVERVDTTRLLGPGARERKA